MKDRATRSDFYTVVERRRRPPKSYGSGAVWRIIHLGGLSGVLQSDKAFHVLAASSSTSEPRSGGVPDPKAVSLHSKSSGAERGGTAQGVGWRGDVASRFGEYSGLLHNTASN